jgi:glycosyltransferase involved in cell wall biosynthesis
MRPWHSVLASYLARGSRLARARDVDVIWVEKEAFPWLPAAVEPRGSDVPLVLDYDDAIFHRYDQHVSPLVRNLLGDKIPRLMARARCVVVGNEYLAQHAHLAGAGSVEVVPTCIDVSRYSVAKRSAASFVVGWIGSPSTAAYLTLIRDALRGLHQRGDVEFRFVGAPKDLDLGVPYRAVDWSEEGEVEAIQQFDCGIMPLRDEPFERGKCGYKLIQYMGCGLPVVASPVGANCDIVQQGVTGFLAASTEEWVQSLDALRRDSSLRQRLGAAGRESVESSYSRDVAVDMLERVLRQTAS